jgi:hypothetical protein
MEEDLRIHAAPPRTFTNPDNMVEVIRRGKGLCDLASKQAVGHAVMTGRGDVDLADAGTIWTAGGIEMVDSAINWLSVDE